jgi:hypothetical protein
MGIQRYEINWDTQTINKAKYGIITFYDDHLAALARQREGIAVMLFEKHLESLQKNEKMDVGETLDAIRAYAGEEAAP